MSNVVSLANARAAREAARPLPPSWRCWFGWHHWGKPRAVEVRGMCVTLVMDCRRDDCRAVRAEVW